MNGDTPPWFSTCREGGGSNKGNISWVDFWQAQQGSISDCFIGCIRCCELSHNWIVVSDWWLYSHYPESSRVKFEASMKKKWLIKSQPNRNQWRLFPFQTQLPVLHEQAIWSKWPNWSVRIRTNITNWKWIKHRFLFEMDIQHHVECFHAMNHENNCCFYYCTYCILLLRVCMKNENI